MKPSACWRGAILLCLVGHANRCLAAPRLESGNAELDRLFADAVRAVDESLVDGMIPIPEDPADRVAEVYLPIWLSLSLTHPEASMKTLAQLAEEEHIIDLEGYPERLDPLFWILAAESLDPEFQLRYLLPMARLCRLVWEENRDPETGLLRGGLGWISGHEAFSNLEEPGDEITLCGNFVAMVPWRSPLFTSGILAEVSFFDGGWGVSHLPEFSRSVTTKLWDEGQGRFRRAVGDDDWCGIGNAFGVILHLGMHSDSRRILSGIPWTPYGVPTRFPSDPAMPEWRPNHSVLWETQALWAWVANSYRRFDVLQRTVETVLRREGLLQTGGIDVRSGELVPAGNSIIPAASLLGVVLRGVVGIDCTDFGIRIKPMVPLDWPEALDISGIHIRGATFDFSVEGTGSGIQEMWINEERQWNARMNWNAVDGAEAHVRVLMNGTAILECPDVCVAGEVCSVRVLSASADAHPGLGMKVSLDSAPTAVPQVDREGDVLRYEFRMPDHVPWVYVEVPWIPRISGSRRHPTSDLRFGDWRGIRAVEPLSIRTNRDGGVFLSASGSAKGASVSVRLTNHSKSRLYDVSLQAKPPLRLISDPATARIHLQPGDEAEVQFRLRSGDVDPLAETEIEFFAEGEWGEKRILVPLWRLDGIDLAGEWRFRIGDDLAWADPAVSDASWDTIRVPGWWEDQGFSDEGWAWYRRTIVVPEDWNGAWSVISAGAIDDEDTLFINGKQVASGKGWETPRRYVIPPDALRPGEPNLVAIRVKDYYGGGGINKGPVRWIAGPSIEFLEQR